MTTTASLLNKLNMGGGTSVAGSGQDFPDELDLENFAVIEDILDDEDGMPGSSGNFGSQTAACTPS